MLPMIKRKNEATQSANELKTILNAACALKVQNFQFFPKDFLEDAYIVGFIAGFVNALIDLECLKQNAIWTMNSEKWSDKVRMNFQVAFIQNLDDYGTTRYHRSILEDNELDKLLKLDDFENAKRYGFLFCALFHQVVPKDMTTGNTSQQNAVLSEARGMAQRSNNDFDVKTSLLSLTLWQHVYDKWGSNERHMKF
jgi:hypothetical protein